MSRLSRISSSSHPATLLTALALTLSHSALAQTVDDPYPEKIAKGMTIGLQEVASGLAAPVLLLPAPGDPKRLFVVDQAGPIHLIQDGKLAPKPFFDLTPRLAKLSKDFDERGTLGLAFDPDFNNEGKPGYRRFFTYTSEPAEGEADFPNPHLNGKPNHHSVIAAWKVSASDLNTVDESSRVEVLRIAQPQFNHDGGHIEFGPDGFLYIALGDGGGANDLGPGHNPETGNAQDTSSPLGKMLRIDVNGKNAKTGKYGIPADNPYVNGGGLPEIYAIGLRNPYRFSFHGEQLLVGDVGQNKLEYLYRLEKGGNYGWRLKEGSFKFNKNGTIERDKSGLPQGLTDPILEYDHDEGTSIIGGYVYRGKAIPELAGKYIFADYLNPRMSSGRLFYSDLTGGKITEFTLENGKNLGFNVKGMGQDADGEIYVMGSPVTGPTGNKGVVLKLVPAK